MLLSDNLTETKPKKRLYIVAAVGAVLVLGIAIFLSARFHKPPNNANAPEGTQWICANGHQFTLSTTEVDRYYAQHYGERMKCPDCGADADRAVVCPHCHQLVAPHTSRTCPNCHQPLSH